MTASFDYILPLLKHSLHNIWGFENKDFTHKVRYLRKQYVWNLELNIFQFNFKAYLHFFVSPN